MAEYIPKYNSKHDSARSDVYYQEKVGHLKPQPCEATNAGPHEGKVEAHHMDYNDPKKIAWLCEKHHAMLRSKNIISALKKFIPKK